MRNYEAFQAEVKRLAEVSEIGPESKLSHLDSMALTELCILSEELLQIEISFAEIKEACSKNYWALMDLLEERASK